MKFLKLFCPILIFIFNINCSNAQQAANSVVNNLSVTEFIEKYKSTPNAQLLDVRTPSEWTQSNIANATKCDFNSANFKQNAAQLDKSKPIFVYCAAGGRSGKAAKILEELGFSKIFNLKGAGNADLQKAGL
jgi:rhodanese-related sulfurtransferase